MKPRNGNLLIAGGILVVGLVISAAAIRLRPEPPRTAPPSSVPRVTTAPVIPWTDPLVISGSGSVRPSAEVDVVPQVGGRVVWVSPRFVSGGRVRAGEPLLRIEVADFQNLAAQARAQVAQDEVSLLQAEREARVAADEFGRFQARSGTADAPSPLTLRQPQLDAARAALERSRASLADAELALGRTEITAAFDGVVRTESIDVGGVATPGQPVGRLFASDAVEVVVPIADADAGLLAGVWDLRAGDPDGRLPARVFTALGTRRFVWEGYVDRAEAALDEQTRTIDVVVRVPRPFDSGRLVDGSTDHAAPPLLVGQFAEVEMQGEVGDYHLIPRAGLQVDDEVWVVDEGAVRMVPVEVVQRRGSDVFVRGALDPGDAIVTGGIAIATEGMRVEVAEDAGGTR